MGIEENIERIAISLEKIADAQNRLATVFEWQQERLTIKSKPAEETSVERSPVEEKKQWTQEEAHDYVMSKGYEATPEWRDLMKKALKVTGKEYFRDLTDEDRPKFIAEFDRLREEGA